MKWVAFLAFAVFSLAAGDVSRREPFRHSQREAQRQKVARIPNYRLPRDILPDHYDIKLLPFLIEGNFTIDGQVKITFTCYEATNSITLHIKDMTIETPEVTSVDGTESFTVESVTEFDVDTEQITITVDRAFEVSTQYVVSIKFLGNLSDRLAGFYRSSYVNPEGVRRWLAVTQFESTDARFAFPCFDEPNMKAKFTITLGRTLDYSTLSNSILVETVPHEFDLDYVWDIYKETKVVMSTYLVAFLVSDFVKFEGSPTSSGTPIAHWANPNYGANQAVLGLEVTPKIMEFMEQYTGLQYSLEKLDQLAIPNFASGAMENWGLITYQEYLLMWDGPLMQAASREQSIVGVIGHELAHQWFGDLVTCDYWDVIWLNEGFATFFEYQATQAARPTWQADQLFLADTVQYVMNGLDSLDSTRPMYVDVESNDDLNVFDSIAYEKSGSVIRMVQDFLTPEVFRRGLQIYLNNRQFMNAEMIDLFAAWDEAAQEASIDLDGATIPDIMNTWAYQKNFPLITVTRNYGAGSASVVQQRFLRPNYPKAEEYSWWVPLTFTQDFSAPVQRKWHTGATVTLPIAGLDDAKPLFSNVRAQGYYRVNYDVQNWQLITDQLTANKDSIEVRSRSQILDDALALARVNYASYETAFDATRFLKDEVEFLPWETFDNDIVFLDNLLASRLAYADFKVYVARLVRNLYNSVTFEDSVNDDVITLYKRIIAVRWACKFGLTDCVNNANALYDRWVASGGLDSSFISPNQKSAVLCNAIRHGGQEDFDFAVNIYATEVNSPDRAAVLTALTCTRDPVLINRLLEWSITNATVIPKSAAPSVYTNLANNPIGRNQAFLFLRDNWDSAKQYFGRSNEAARGIADVSKFFSLQSELDELTAFRDSHNDDYLVVSNLAASIERAQANVEWAAVSYQTIADWLFNEVIGKDQ